MCWGIGSFLAAGILRGTLNVPGDGAWKLPYGLQWVWPLPLFFVAWLAPESKSWVDPADIRSILPRPKEPYRGSPRGCQKDRTSRPPNRPNGRCSNRDHETSQRNGDAQRKELFFPRLFPRGQHQENDYRSHGLVDPADQRRNLDILYHTFPPERRYGPNRCLYLQHGCAECQHLCDWNCHVL